MKYTNTPPLYATVPSPRAKDTAKGWHSRGYLPHFDQSNIYQFITYCLAGIGGVGVPPASNTPASNSPAQKPESSKLTKKEKRKQRIQIEQELDKGHGPCILKDKEIAKIVVDAWIFFDSKRYDLIAYVVMPNHVHLLIKTFEGYPLSSIIHSWKSFTAHEIVKCLKLRDSFDSFDSFGDSFVGFCERDARAPASVWQRDYFDRFIRDKRHFSTAVSYIHENPVKAGLCRHACEWPWSSAKEGVLEIH